MLQVHRSAGCKQPAISWANRSAGFEQYTSVHYILVARFQFFWDSWGRMSTPASAERTSDIVERPESDVAETQPESRTEDMENEMRTVETPTDERENKNPPNSSERDSSEEEED